MSASCGVADDLRPPFEGPYTTTDLSEEEHEARMEAITSITNETMTRELEARGVASLQSSARDGDFMDQVILIVGHLLHRRDAIDLACWMRSVWLFCEATKPGIHFDVEAEPLGMAQSHLGSYRCAPSSH